MHQVGRVPRSRIGAVAALIAALLGAHWQQSSGAATEGPVAGRAAVLQHISVSASRAGAVLTLTLSSPVEQHLLRLHSPERLVIDLPRTRRRAALPPIPKGTVLASVRAAVRHQRDLRLVLELEDGPALKVTPLISSQGRQLRIEVGEAPRAHPAAVELAPANAPLGAIRAAHAPQGQRDVIVAIDPGHGGLDPGATGRDGTHEKEVTLAIARSLAARIDREPGMRAVLTRDSDEFVVLRDRMERARAAHADLFISIHADSVADPAISGASVYVLSERGASSEAARRLAEQENAADLKGGVSLAAQPPNLRSVLLDLSQNASIGQSAEAAKDVLGALDGLGAVRKREVQQAAFVVLKSPDIPSMLIETAYISNQADATRLRSATEQQRLAEAIFSGIAHYFRDYPPQGSLFAHAPRSTSPAPS